MDVRTREHDQKGWHLALVVGLEGRNGGKLAKHAAGWAG